MTIFNRFPARPILAAILLMAVISSCRKYELNGDVVDNSALLEKLYQEAKDTVTIDNQDLILETELTRDFFPGVPDRNTRLFALISIVNTDSSLITNRLEIKTLYIIDRNQIWISAPNHYEDSYIPVFKLSALSKNGPEWETGVPVDVVLKIENLMTGNMSYLIARQQLIIRAD